jgi:histidyl-tRNA synthetase
VLESIGLGGDQNAGRRLTVLRAIDKLDRLGPVGVKQLLGPGRKDESGDFTKGAGLDGEQAEVVLAFLEIDVSHNPSAALVPRDNPLLANMKGGILYAIPAAVERSPRFAAGIVNNTLIREGVHELDQIRFLVDSADYGEDRIQTSFSVVRGLEYYTGSVFEAQLTFEVRNEDGQLVRFGSVGGGGRYDGLVERFTGTKVPATGFSIGVSRLQAALAAIGKTGAGAARGPVVVLVMDKAELPRYQKLTQTLRQAGIRAEMYLGTAGMKAQMKYADKRGSPCVVIQGGDERARGEVQIKDLIEGAKAATTIKDSKEWREGRPAQISVPEANLVAAVRDVLARHKG